MYIIPVGGIGNRWRVVESLLSNDKNINITIIDIRTNYFPLCFNQVFNVPKNINIISIPLVWNDFFMVKITKMFTNTNPPWMQNQTTGPNAYMDEEDNCTDFTTSNKQ